MNYLFHSHLASRREAGLEWKLQSFHHVYGTWMRQSIDLGLRVMKRRLKAMIQKRRHRQRIKCEIYLTQDEGVTRCCIIYTLVFLRLSSEFVWEGKVEKLLRSERFVIADIRSNRGNLWKFLLKSWFLSAWFWRRRIDERLRNILPIQWALIWNLRIVIWDSGSLKLLREQFKWNWIFFWLLATLLVFEDNYNVLNW